MANPKRVAIKRAYEAPEEADGTRILVDRVWPRGLSKDDLKIDLWLRDIAPSTELRKWFGHDPARWDEFRRRYFRELDGRRDLVAELRKKIAGKNATLVFSAREARYNNAAALKDYLERS